jgi:hypothetical protein
MIKIFTLSFTITMLVTLNGVAQNTTFDSIGYVQLQTGKLLQKGDVWVIRVGEGNNARDYAPVNLTGNMQVANQDVVFSGAIGRTAPNVRLAGTPLKIHTIRRLYKTKPGDKTDRMEPKKNAINSQTDSVGSVSGGKGKISKIGDTWVIDQETENIRYVPDYLPQDFQVQGLQVTFSGTIKKSDPNVRIMGKPFTIKEIIAEEEESFDINNVQEPLRDFYPIDSAGYLQETKAFVKKLSPNDAVFYIEVGGTRYLPVVLPAEFAIDNLPVYVSGVIGKIPANVRLAGTPLEIKTIRKG